jgi:hypothetical protein
LPGASADIFPLFVTFLAIIYTLPPLEPICVPPLPISMGNYNMIRKGGWEEERKKKEKEKEKKANSKNLSKPCNLQ